jgi:hypothetical protein
MGHDDQDCVKNAISFLKREQLGAQKFITDNDFGPCGLLHSLATFLEAECRPLPIWPKYLRLHGIGATDIISRHMPSDPAP